MRVVVVGAGITGLAAAHWLVELAAARSLALELRVWEAGPRAGGVIGTERRDGFLAERGPDMLATDKPWALDLCRRLGLQEHLIGTNQGRRRTYVVRRGRLVEVPEGFLLMAPGRVWPIVRSPVLSWRGKLRMAMDLVLPRRRSRVRGRGSSDDLPGSWALAALPDDESLASFVRRRLGREALERLVQPLVGGIYMADPDRLSLRATLPRFLEMERDHRSLILASRRRLRSVGPQPSERGADGDRAAGKRNAAESGARYGMFVSLRDGMQTLVDALVGRLPPGSVECGAGVSAIARMEAKQRTGGESDRGKWRVERADGKSVHADAVILAVSAYRAAELLRDHDRELAGLLDQIPYVSSAVVAGAYRRGEIGHPLDGFGFVVPRVEGRGIVACSFSSVKFAGRAPEGHVLLRTFLGGALEPRFAQWDDADLQEIVRRELGDLLSIRGRPLWTLVSRYERAMPQYHVGHLQRVREIEQRAAAHPGLLLAGNAYHGVGIPDCIHSGEQAAERAVG